MVAGMWRNIPKIPWDSASLKCSLLKSGRMSSGEVESLMEIYLCCSSCVKCPQYIRCAKDVQRCGFMCVFKTKTHRCSSGGTTSECNGAPS